MGMRVFVCLFVYYLVCDMSIRFQPNVFGLLSFGDINLVPKGRSVVVSFNVLFFCYISKGGK